MSEKKLSLADFRNFLEKRGEPRRTSGHATRAWNAIGRNLGVPSESREHATYITKSVREVLDRNRTDPNFKWMEGQGDVRGIGKQAQQDLFAFLEEVEGKPN